MNILYIIGNGLDIAHHMNTSYPEFIEYYLGLPSSEEDIQSMKKAIDKERYTTWADLEIGLGKYSAKCKSKEEFLRCLFDMKGRLVEYLKKESEKIAAYSALSFANFVDPGRLLDPESLETYHYFSTRKGFDSTYNVITFNYTNTIESLLKPRVRTISVPKVKSILHIHGDLDEMMVMGVNDISQISNEAINTDIDILEEFVKPEYNDACKNNKNYSCEKLIYDADVIVLYGTSLGLSDNKWWKLIGHRLSGDNYPLLIYLPYDKKKNLKAEPNHLRRWTREYVNEVHNKFDIEIDKKNFESRMCVAINKQLFPLTKTVATK